MKTKAQNGRKITKPSFENFYQSINPEYADTTHYDLRQAYEKLPYKTMKNWVDDPDKNHLSDTYKLPTHPTFSDESVYFNPKTKKFAGKWIETDSSYNYTPYDTLIKKPVIDMKTKKKITKAQNGKKVITGDPLYDNLLNKRDSVVQASAEGLKNWDYFLKKGMQKIKLDKANQLQKLINQQGVIEDDMGQLKHPGKVTKINSNQITMKGVNYPVLGVDNIGNKKMMYPEQEYEFGGSSVTEYPMANSGIHIKKSHKGLLHKNLGVPQGEKIPASKLSIKATDSPAVKKRKQFAINAKSWNKGQMGTQIPFDPNANIGNIPPIETNWGSENIFAPGRYSVEGQASQFNSTLPQPQQQGFLGKMGEKLGGPMGILNTATSLIGGIQQIGQDREAKREAKQAYRLSKVVKQAASLDPENVKRKYHRPEDQIFNPNEMGSPTGVGTNYLAEDGATLEYVPLDKTNVKQFQQGGFLQQTGQFFGGIDPRTSSNLGSMLGSAIGGGKGAPSGASQVGSTIGGAAGSLLGPVGEKIGGFLGGAVGGLIGGKNQRQTANYNRKANNNLMAAAFQQGVGDLRNSYTGFMKDGGNLAMGGDLETYWGGGATPISENPYLPDGGQTVMFNGASHENGGIGVKFGGKSVEVEGGEPAVKLKDGGKDNLTVFGNMKIPPRGVIELNDPKAKNKKFKSYVADLSRTEAKQNNIVNKNLKMVDELDVSTPYDKLTLSSGHAMLEGANMKLKEIAQKKQTASMVQNAILETAEEFGLESDALAKGKIKKAKNGMKIAQDGKRISRTEVEEYLKQGYQPLPEDPNRLFKKSSFPGETKTVNMGTPRKGSEEFNRAFSDARRQKLEEFKFKGKKYNTDLFNAKTKTVTSPGKESVDYIDIYDPETSQGKTPFGVPQISPFNTPQKAEKTGLNWMDVVNTALPYLRPSNQLNLDPNQLAGERYALATNQQDPVQAQLYHPLLEQPMDMSLQDQMNANQSDFNQIQRQVGNNPAALASLAGQKYTANTGVLGEQFRLNQANKQGVYNKNRGTLNDAQLKNLAILDQQYVRQSTAKSNTKATAQAALNSISDKIQRNKLENKTLGIYENLYNYRYGPKGHAYNLNPLADFQFPSAGDTNLQYLDSLVPQGKEPEFNSRGQLKDVGSKAKKRNGSIVKAIKNL